MKKRALFTQFLFGFLLCLGVLVSACATNSKNVHASLVRENERMFWTLTGTDKNGETAKVYIQGTIHVGDERLFPLSPVVVSAWETSDRIAGEISSEGYENMEVMIQGMVLESYLNAKGRNIYDYLTEKQKETLYAVVDKDSADALVLFEPWVMTNLVTNSLYTDSGLSAEGGLDQWFIDRANESERPMLGLDELETQLELLRFGTYEQQLYILQEGLDDLADGKTDDEDTAQLYELYLTDDEDGIASLVSEEFILNDPSELAFAKEYNKMMYDDRNKAWADKIRDWLYEGGTTFIFAGSAHFVGERSVFYYLEQNGTLTYYN